jgi:tripartite-type tricarboxylate transporter receptor subunit TctC
MKHASLKLVTWSLALGLGMTAGPLLAAPAYPVKPVRIIVPAAPGGGTDILARLLAQKLTESFGSQVIVENRPGAGQLIGTELVAHAAPDGYTILMAASAIAYNQALYKKLPYDTIKDFAPITGCASLPNILLVHPALPAKTVRELLALARSRPDELNYASSGLGTSPHMSMELFRAMTGIKMGHIPYKGTGPAMIDVISGQVPIMMINVLSAQPHVKSGRLRPLAVTSSTRAGAYPELPTIAEAGVPGYESISWYGVLAPAATPRDIIDKLNGAIVRALRSPEAKERLASDGAEVMVHKPEEFGQFIKVEVAKWSKLVASGNIKPE